MLQSGKAGGESTRRREIEAGKEGGERGVEPTMNRGAAASERLTRCSPSPVTLELPSFLTDKGGCRGHPCSLLLVLLLLLLLDAPCPKERLSSPALSAPFIAF